MDSWVSMLITFLCSVMASSGFWAFLQKRSDKNDAKTELLVGLAHDRIMYLGSKYIERGWMTADEYENLKDYLYAPYVKNGGNGSAQKLMNELDKKIEIVSVDDILKGNLPK